MPTPNLVSVEEYLTSSFDPDCDYVDGHIEERNLGERSHSKVQMRLLVYLSNRYEKDGIEVYPELRIRVKPARFRVSDLCITLGDPGEEILTKPPFLCVEIVSPEDRMIGMKQRIDDYLTMGVPYVWVLDPETKHAYAATSTEGLRQVMGGALQTANPVLEVPLAEIFR